MGTKSSKPPTDSKLTKCHDDLNNKEIIINLISMEARLMHIYAQGIVTKKMDEEMDEEIKVLIKELITYSTSLDINERTTATNILSRITTTQDNMLAALPPQTGGDPCYHKYLKYKHKYLNLKTVNGSSLLK